MTDSGAPSVCRKQLAYSFITHMVLGLLYVYLVCTDVPF